MYACTSAPSRVPLNVQPIKFCARAAPIDAPTPTLPPIARENAALMTVASIDAVLLASMSMLPELVRTLSFT